MFKIGFHTGPGGNRNGLGDYFRALDAAGIPAVIKAADAYGPVGELATLARDNGVDHVMVFRLSTDGQDDGFDYDVPNYGIDPTVAAAHHWQATLAKLPPEFDRDLVWLELVNEVDKNRADWLGAFGVAIVNLAMPAGYKVALPSWAAGEPEVDDWETPGMLEFLRVCARHPDKVAVSLHEYSYQAEDLNNGSPWLVGRFDFLLDVCDAHNIDSPTIMITEFGWTYNDIPDNLYQALVQLAWANSLYENQRQVLGAAIWYLGGGFGGIANKVQRLISPVTELALRHGPPEPVVPNGLHKAIVVKAPQEVSREEWRTIADRSFDIRHTQTASHDDMLTVLRGGNAESFVKMYEPQRPSQVESIAFLEAEGFTWEPHYISGSPPDDDLLFDAWPTDHRVVTQHFGVRPDVYARFGLPGHGGIDVRAPLTSNVYAVLPGTVAEIRNSPNGLGINVRIDHSHRRQTTYGHLEEILVAVGDSVAVEELIARANNSGFSGASHLHLMLKDFSESYVDENGVIWPYNIHDPSPFLRHLAPDQFVEDEDPVSGTGPEIDLLPYMAGVLSGRSNLHELQMHDGPQERVQVQWQAQDALGLERFYITKGSEVKANWEERWSSGDLIYFGTDTSESEERYYTQRLGTAYGAPWCKRRMRIGEWFYRTPSVTHYFKSDCQPVGDAAVVGSYLGLAAVYDEFVFENGINLPNVVEMVWAWAPGGEWIERYLFAQNHGLVGWFSSDGRRSYVSELHAAGARPDNRMEVIACLDRS